MNLDSKKRQRKNGSNLNEKVPIGFENISRGVDGITGEFVPAGSTIGITLDPLSMGEVFTYKLFDTDRPTLYVVVDRSESETKQEIELATEQGVSDVDKVVQVDPSSTSAVNREIDKFSDQNDDFNLVVNSVTSLYGENVFDGTKKIHNMSMTGAGITYAVFPYEKPNLSSEQKRSLGSLDGVFQIQSSERLTSDISDTLAVTKLRGAPRPNEKIPLNIGETVTASNENKISG